MSYSAVQLIAVSGMLQNTGIGVNPLLVAQLDNMQNSASITGKLRRVAVHPNASPAVITAMRTTLPGICMVAPIAYTEDGRVLSSSVEATDISESIRTRADLFFLDGVNGFLGILSRADAICYLAREVLGAVYAYDGATFADATPDATKHIDLATGGLSSKFGPLAKNSDDYRRASGLYSAGVGAGGTITTGATDVRRSIRAVGEAIQRMGTLYDFQDLQNIGTPYGLIKSLYNQGLLSSKSSGRTDTTDSTFIVSLASENITIETLATANVTTLTEILTKVTRPEFLDKVIKATGLTVPTGVVINNAADFLKAEKVMPASAARAIPNGSLYQLGQQLISLNVAYPDKDSLVNALLEINVPDHTNLEQLSRPVSAADITIIRNTVPSGTGDFGASKIQELIGTPSGYVHLDALEKIALIASKLSSTTQGSAVIIAADAVYAKYVLFASATTEEAALITAINQLAAVTAYQDNITITTVEISKIVDQIELEVANCDLAGLDLTETILGNSITLASISNFPNFGVDYNNSGIRNMLINMVTDDRYGEAIRASLIQGQNDQILQTIGARTIGVPDIKIKAAEYQFGSGQTTLSNQQRENVIADARAQGLSESNAIQNAELYGYNNQYYVSRGYPTA